MHLAFKSGNYDFLIRMIEAGGNPFVKNKNGEAVEYFVEAMNEDDRYKEKLLKIINLYIEHEGHQVLILQNYFGCNQMPFWKFVHLELKH